MSGLELLAPMALVALGPLAAIIIVLYLLKLRRRELAVPSVFLWRRAVEDLQANAPFQRLRVSLLLLLQLLALAALVLGLAAPFVMARRLPGETAVIVLDVSASMSATDVEGSRLEQAKRRARQIARAMSRRDEGALVACGARGRVLVPLTGDRRRLLSALERLRSTDQSGNMTDGLLLGLSLAAKRPRATVYLISDGAFAALPEVSTCAKVRFITVGERSDNVALLAFEAARPAGAAEHQVFVRLHNYAPTRKQCVLSIYHEDELIDARRIELEAGAGKVETYAAAIAQAGLLRAELEADDDLAADNVAYALVTPPAARSILLVGPGNLFLLQALLVLPEVEVFETESLSEQQAEQAYEKYDVVIFDRTPIPAPPQRGAVMAVAASGWLELASPGEKVETPTISRWDKQHPALRYVNLSAVQIAQAYALGPGPDAVALAHAGGAVATGTARSRAAGEAPMIVAYEQPEVRGLALGWNLMDSDLPLRVGFPVLLSNAIRWLGEVGGGQQVRVVRPGETLSISAPPEAAHAEVLLPDGGRSRLDVVGGQIIFAHADRVGVYRMTVGEQRRRWAVDLRDPHESDLAPRRELKLGAHRVETGVRELRAERHFWPYLALLALLALVAEWHLFHRRY